MSTVKNFVIKDSTVNEVLLGKKYKLEFYQRGYRWTEKETYELLTDLTNSFTSSYVEGDAPESVEGYAQYLLGDVVIANKEYETETGKNSRAAFIVDGQQRLTTLTLLFIYLLSKQDNMTQLTSYISSEKYGKKNFVIDVPIRKDVMNYLLSGNKDAKKEANFKNSSLEEKNIIQNYAAIKRFFKENAFDTQKLELFTYWLEERVVLGKNTVNDISSAYGVFEAMNTRGRNLTNAELLKGLVINYSGNDTEKKEAEKLWLKVFNKFEKEEDFDKFVKVFIQGRYAHHFKTHDISLMTNQGFFRLENWFYKFIKNVEEESFSSSKTEGFDFLEKLDYYSDLYFDILSKTKNVTPGFEKMAYFNSFLNHDWINVYFCAIEHNDDKKEEKIKIVTEFVDLLSGTAFFGSRTNIKNNGVNQKTIHGVRTAMEQSRDSSDTDFLRYALHKNITKEYADKPVYTENIENTSISAGNSTQKKNVLYTLLRVSNFLELTDGKSDMFINYENGKYQIEHLLSSVHSVNSSNEQEFIDKEDFQMWRDRIGALGILDKSTNASFQDMPYSEKVDKYTAHNRFLGMLSSISYREDGGIANSPRLNRLVEKHPEIKGYLKPVEKVGKAEISQRTLLIGALCKIIWNPENLLSLKGTDFETSEQLLEHYASIYDSNANNDNNANTVVLEGTTYEQYMLFDTEKERELISA